MASFYFRDVRNKLTPLLCFIPLIMSLVGNGQQSSFKTYDSQWHVRLFPDIRSTIVTVENGQKNEALSFQPNNPVRISTAIHKGNLGIGISLFKLAQNSNRTHGRTRGVDVFAELFRDQYSAILRLQRYTGWYSRENPDGIPTNLNLKNYIRSDIRNFAISSRFIYYFNTSSYSIKAPINFTEVQLKSSGTLLASITPFANSFSGDSSLVPGYGNQRQAYISRFVSYGVNFGLGYAYTHVFDNPLFINATLIPGLALAGQTTQSKLVKEHTFNLPFQLLLRGTIGYNTPQYFFGLSPRLAHDFAQETPLNHNISSTVSQITVYLGMRW